MRPRLCKDCPAKRRCFGYGSAHFDPAPCRGYPLTLCDWQQVVDDAPAALVAVPIPGRQADAGASLGIGDLLARHFLYGQGTVLSG